MIANANQVTVCQCLFLDALPEVLKSIGRAQIHNVVGRAVELNHGVLSRHVGIFNRKIATLLAAANDEFLLVDDEILSLVTNL